MAEWFRVLNLLIYKNFLVRKRHWLISIIGEVIVPVGTILCIWLARNYLTIAPEVNEQETIGKVYSQTSLLDVIPQSHMFYAPNNSFTDQLMKEVDRCFSGKMNITGFNTEEELLSFYLDLNKFGKCYNCMAIIFEDDTTDDVQHLNYKIRPKFLEKQSLYNNYGSMFFYYTRNNNFAQTQICIDESFLKLKSNDLQFNLEINVQEFPYPPYSKPTPNDGVFRMLFGVLLIIVFLIPLFIETGRATSEKFLGINVLMSMNGVSNALNLLSWIISGFIFLSIFCILPVFVLMISTTGEGLALAHYSNPFIVWLLLNLYVVHLLTYGIHVSSYFSKPLYVIFALLFTSIISTVLQMYVFNEKTFWASYVGILLPNILIHRAIDEINFYEGISKGVHWNNIFQSEKLEYKLNGSIGMLLIFSVIGIIFNYCLTVYIYVINPGKYGMKKHPLFFLKSKFKYNSDDIIENVECNGIEGKLFEPTQGIYTAGIQIRNLKKSYNIGFFNKSKVQALKGISIDFYKGQITSILGHNGAGKTTLMSILTGMMSPSDGVVLIDSKNISNNTAEVMNDMGLCTQENMLFPSLSIGEQLEFFAILKGKGKKRAAIKQDVTAFLEKLKLKDKKNVLPNQLSGGQKRRVCLGMALIGGSSTLVLDEPTSGLDPESKRIIWDILLKMRGQKTILISTHDMEEADILGDRIAILQAGQLKSYGTSMFLKKLVGQNNVEVTLSIESWCDPKKVEFEIDGQGKIIYQDSGKIIISIPNSPDNPDLLDNIERKKKDLGISGLSVSLITLEQVFLKLTQEDDSMPKYNLLSISNIPKLTGCQLFTQSLKGLFRKKVTYTFKNLSTILIKLLMIFLITLIIPLTLKQIGNLFNNSENYTPISLNLYNNPVTYYKTNEDEFGMKYRHLTENFHGKSFVANDSSIIQALLDYAKENLVFYDNHLIAASEFHKTNYGTEATALFSNKATFSFPISLNLITNAIAQSILGENYSISLSGQQLPSPFLFNSIDLSQINAIITAIIFLFFISPLMALFVIHPLRESSTNIKQLQQMTGVSSFTYWGAMFIFDMVICFVLIGLLIIGFLFMDYVLELKIYQQTEILITLLSLIAFCLNILPFTYLFSFLNTSTSATVRLLTYIPLGVVTLEIVMYIIQLSLYDSKTFNDIRPIQKGIMLLIPHVSFLHNQISFHWTSQSNARCRILPNYYYDFKCNQSFVSEICCELKCYNGECEKYKDYFKYYDNGINLKESFLYLGLTPLLYFGILFMLEYQVFQKLRAKLRRDHFTEEKVDEQVKNEKMIIYQKILAMNKTDNENTSENSTMKNNGRSSLNETLDNLNNLTFFTFELRRRYGKLIAVKDVSFRVHKRECFGLLGVNGAGKSTTFRMMTGTEVPDNGMLYIGDKDLEHNRKYYLSQMGYCPQTNAIIKSLNAYDHLRLFARLRGIPEDQVENEIQTWILRLNLTVCASQPSGTYSGGNKRRLNIAIALIGLPNLVLMDEPTTGVDPGARRSLWNVIQSCQKAGQAIILTSHSMEECEVLCNRLAIMIEGKLVCIGPSQELKQRFGAGYDIQIKLNPGKTVDQIRDLKNDIVQTLDCELIDENLSYLMYHVKPHNIIWKKMYDVMNMVKAKFNCIDDFFIQSSNLEQLFLLFSKNINNKNKID